MSETKRERPSVATSLRSLPFLSNTLLSWLLAATFLMPFAVGCDKTTILTPVDSMTARVRDDGALGVLSELYVQWPYLYGMVFPFWLILIAFVRPKRLGRWLVPFPLLFLVPLAIAGTLAFSRGEPSPDSDLKERLIWFLILVVPQVFVLLWMIWWWRKEGALAGAIRGLSGLSALASYFVYLFAAFEFASRFLYGFYLSVVSAIGLTFSTWLLQSHGERTFSDERLPIRPIQFRIRTVLIWTTLIAIVTATYQAVTHD